MGLRVRLEHAAEGARQPFRLATPEPPGAGVVREGEHGAPGRRVRLDLNAFDARARNGVARRISPLLPHAQVDDGGLLIGPGAPDRLPRGTYELLVLIDDLTVAEKRRVRAEVDRNGDSQVVLRVVPRSLRFSRKVADFDPALVAFLEGPSRIDGGQTLAGWLESPLPPQPKRCALLMNVLAMLRGLSAADGGALTGAAGEEPSLLALVKEVIQVEVDHMRARVSPALRGALREIHASFPGVVFKDRSIDSSHTRAIEAIAPDFGLTPGRIDFESYRFAGAPSLQIVMGFPDTQATATAADHIADIDLDLGNPLQDVRGLVVHVGELFDDGLDHVRLRDRLCDTPAGPFLYYEAA